MHHDYRDITERISTPPTWWDENGCPRWGEFAPDMVPDIYADEACLLEIECQGCGRRFEVAMSSSRMRRLRATWLRRGIEMTVGGVVPVSDPSPSYALIEQIAHGFIHYGDPPNHVDEDHAGSTMNSIPIRVIQFWDREPGGDWRRVADAEIVIGDEGGAE